MQSQEELHNTSPESLRRLYEAMVRPGNMALPRDEEHADRLLGSNDGTREGRSRRVSEQSGETMLTLETEEYRRNIPFLRADVSRAVYVILRDNLSHSSLASQVSKDELRLVADSIEVKLYQTAPTLQAYYSFSTLEFRISALATAVLIHSDKGPNVSEMCARLSAAARKSLVYSGMVLVSYEKQNLDKKMRRRRMTRAHEAMGYSHHHHQEGSRMTEGTHSLHHDAAHNSSDLYDSQRPKDHRKTASSVQKMISLEDPHKIQPFPPSA